MHQVLTLAAIVEREVVIPEERPIIASVYRNRIDEGMPLQADPTVQYAIRRGRAASLSSATGRRSFAAGPAVHLGLQHLREAGLPPGPIGSVSIDAIEAVIRPAKTNYLFFVARSNGSHVFSDDLRTSTSSTCSATSPEQLSKRSRSSATRIGHSALAGAMYNAAFPAMGIDATTRPGTTPPRMWSRPQSRGCARPK